MKSTNSKPLFLCFLFNLFLFSGSIFSQTNAVFKNDNFVVLESKTELSQSDIKKVESSNFDTYRFYSIRKKVQIVRGPLIELLSIKELEEKGIVFSKELVDLAKSKSESFKHESILNLDLGLGIYPAHEPK